MVAVSNKIREKYVKRAIYTELHLCPTNLTTVILYYKRQLSYPNQHTYILLGNASTLEPRSDYQTHLKW